MRFQIKSREVSRVEFIGVLNGVVLYRHQTTEDDEEGKEVEI